MTKLKIKSVFSSEFISPENEISWEKRSTEITSDAGKTIFKQEGVEIPKSWSPLATKIAVSKYFYGDISNGTDPTKGGRESSIKQLVSRVTETIAKWGMQDGYFESEKDAETFGNELKWLCLNQYGAFNSPVWFNVGLYQKYGVDGGQTGNWVYDKATDKAAIWKNQYEYPQASACFIQSVDDTMESIMKLAYSEAMLFKYGSGTGSDLSTIRSTKEKLSGGGKPSGPMSFLKIYDQVAGTVKSGGKCLAPNQLVYTEVGPIAVKELAESEKDFVVLSYDPPAGRMKAKWARAWQSGNKPVVKIETDKGEFHVSFDHPMRLADDQTVRAGDLIVGQRLHAVTVIDQNGYKSVRSKGSRELLHRLVAQDIGGFDIDGHVVHHKDEVVANCHPDNLALMEDQSEHAGLHSNVLVASGEHVFQTNSFKHSGEYNGMHQDSDFWKDEQKVAAYQETQGSILTESGRAADMQKVAADQKMLNTAWTLLNSGFQIETWKDYRFAREKLTGRMGDPRKVLSAIVDRFGSYELFRKEVDAQNHCVVSVTPMGNLDVYSVEVDCPTVDDKSANSGHTYTLWPIGNNASKSAGVLCMNTRRAAKMNTLKTSHPDIEEFIDAKAKEERKAWALIDAGYDGSFNGDAYGSVMYQNENLSVRADDAFMNAAVENKPYFTLAVKDGKPIEEKNAGVLMTKIAEGTYVCGDPGMQFDDTIHKWHTCKGTARQNSTNPCSEYLFLDNTACNLASLNLIKFKKADGSFDCDRFVAACRIFITAQEILVDRASYPTKEIAENSHIFRTLGLGFANLGALIMSLGLAYDSNEGRAIAGAITSLMTSTAYHQSSLIASFYGEFPGYHNAKCSGISNPLRPSNQESMLEVIALHKKACNDNSNGSAVWEVAKTMWAEAYHMGKIYGYRNAQVTVLAPTGTIGFLMDCDTTGIEPDIALVKYKLLAGGGNLKIVNQSVEPALVTLGYTETEIAKIIRHIDIYDTIEDIGTYGEIAKSGLLSSHLVVFDCAFKAAKGSRSLHYMGHLKMMAACQPFLSGAISKTVNLPESATIDDIRNAYIDGWKMGLKAIAVYRDGSKRSAPLSTKTESKEVAVIANDELDELRSYIASLEANCESPVRKRLPDTRKAINHKFEIAGHKGYLSVGLFDNGDPGEIFISMSKEGSTIGGLVDTVATLTSLSLQYGVPLKDLVNKFAYQRFEPSGFTKNPDIRNATSIIDYVFRWLGCQFVEGYKKETPLLDKAQTAPKALSVNVASSGYLSDPCSNCGSSKVIRSGVCGVCTECGTSQGCS